MSEQTIRLISWNIQGRVANNSMQTVHLGQRMPDLIALQEVRQRAGQNFREELPHYGLVHIEENTHQAIEAERVYGLLIASRWPLSRLLKPVCSIPFPEKLLSVVVHSPFGEFELHTAHIPPGASNEWKKIETFEGIYTYLAHETSTPRIVCGDFNTPQAETQEGEIVTWGQDIHNGEARVWGMWKGDTGQRWDDGERKILEGLAAFDLPDVFRAIHGYTVTEYSWYTRNKVGRRFDHIFASASFNPRTCQYIHAWREQMLSDHSAIEAVFQPNIP